MNSSAQPSRRIASNLLWTPQGLIRHPLIEVAADGRIISIESCPNPDRQPFTEFYAGILIPGFPPDFLSTFSRLCEDRQTPLQEQLQRVSITRSGVLVVIGGLDYATGRLTAQSQITKIG